MAKIAAQLLARGDGWTVEDITCTAGPSDPSFEERHSAMRVAIVVAGTFQYRSDNARDLMTPGSLLLGNIGRPFDCAHEHGTGDRCLSFGYSPSYFSKRGFRVARIPPVRALSPLIARAMSALRERENAPWEEISIRLAAAATEVTGESVRVHAHPSAVARVTRVVRAIERHADAQLSLTTFARAAGLSAFHFLRTFEHVTGVTPHQYLRRVRLREAASRLVNGRDKVIDVALDCGFGDVSAFNRAFRAEFGTTPRGWRATARPQRV